MIQRTVAIYETRCPACPKPIEVGDPIVLTDDGWIHDGCEKPVPESRNPICPECFIQHAGECA